MTVESYSDSRQNFSVGSTQTYQQHTDWFWWAQTRLMTRLAIIVFIDITHLCKWMPIQIKTVWSDLLSLIVYINIIITPWLRIYCSGYKWIIRTKAVTGIRQRMITGIWPQDTSTWLWLTSSIVVCIRFIYLICFDTKYDQLIKCFLWILPVFCT